MSFHVGQKVVYVGGDPNGNNVHRGCGGRVVRGNVYTVREIDPLYIPHFGHPGLRVCEVVHQPVMWCGLPVEPCRTADGFRAVVERHTDISIFTKMLTDASKTLVRADD